MRLFRRKEKRSENSGTVEVEGGLLSAMLSGSTGITKEQALQIPTIAACVTLIADRISALPIKLYRQNGKKVEEITEDKRLNMLNHDTGDTINATEIKKLWIRDYFLGKGAYTYIERNMYNEPTGLLYVDETRVAVMPGADPIHKKYSINVNGRMFFPYQFLKILRNTKGFGIGASIIDDNPLALAIYYNTMRFENTNIRKGGNKRGFLKAGSTVDKTGMDVLKQAWRDLYSNSNDSADNIVVLNSGMDFQEASSTSVELQLNENKQTNAAELCKLFCMPLDILNGKATEATISQFVQNCLMPPINTIESALDSDLLTEAEKDGHYYFAFDTSELTRGDFASRMNAYAVALQNNIYQLDEIREREDLPPLNFNYIRLGLDSVLLDPKTGEIYTPNTDKTAMMNSGLTDDEIRALYELRFNDNHDPVTGQFTSGRNYIGNLIKAGEPIALHHHDYPRGGGGGTGKSHNSIDNSEKSGIIGTENDSYLPKRKVVNILRKDSEEWIKTLSSEEVRAIKKYTKNSGDPKDDKFFARLNAMLRNETPQNDRLNYYSQQITNGLLKFNLEHNIECYRKTDKNYFADRKVGEIIVPGFFMSSSATPGAAPKNDFLTKIYAPKGSKGAYVEFLSKYPNQREFLFDKNNAYRVISNTETLMELEVLV